MTKLTPTQLKPYLIDGFLPSIGIECHVQLKTKTKLFTGVPVATNVPANSQISPLCLGLPGALPVLNHQAVVLAIRAGLALDGEIARQTSFDRKHYFYPDLPLGYQITQHHHPIIKSGSVTIWSPTINQELTIGLQRAHLEADAGKLSHQDQSSLVDLNRVGTPLLEIVSQPELHSPADAKLYLRELYWRMVYAGVCQGDLSQGQMRFDVNVSLSRSLSDLGTRTEIKNLNSFRFVEWALGAEIKRQHQLLNQNQPIIQETRGFDEVSRTTFSQRSKEDAHDYRYMPDPDIPPITIKHQFIADIQAQLPPLPVAIRQQLQAAKIDPKKIETVLEWPSVSIWLASLTKPQPVIERLVNWLVGEIAYLVKNDQCRWSTVLAAQKSLLEAAQATTSKQLGLNLVKQNLLALINNQLTVEALINRQTEQVQAGNKHLKATIKTVIANNPQAVNQFEANPKIISFLIGQVLKTTHGQADPVVVRQLLVDQLQKDD